MWSGILDLARVACPEANVPLRDKLADLNCCVRDYLRGQGTNAVTEEQQVPAINAKLDMLIALMHRMPIPKAA